MRFLFILLFISCSHHQTSSYSDGRIETFCQDLNILHTKISLIASNIANIRTTRTLKGGPYIRKFTRNCRGGFCEIVEANDPPLIKYEPKHPDANRDGYVSFPGFSLASEESEKLHWERVYSAVVGNFGVNEMNNFFLNDTRAERCFKRYPKVNEAYNFQNYLGR